MVFHLFIVRYIVFHDPFSPLLQIQFKGLDHKRRNLKGYFGAFHCLSAVMFQ